MKKPLDTSESPALQRALDEARAALGSERDVQRLRAKLGELPPVPPSGGAGLGGAAQATGLGAKAIGVAAVGVLLIAAAIAFVQRTPDAPAARVPAIAAPAAPPPDVIAPGSASPAAPAPAVELAAPDAAPKPKAIAPRPKLAPAAQAPEAPRAPEPVAPKELELLMSAQDAIEASPQRALGLLDEHARVHPNGSFAIERESLAIDALRKLGRVSAAQARARAFIAAFPNAANAKHLRRWLDESASTEHKEEAQPLPKP
jgi:hypothetical protein